MAPYRMILVAWAAASLGGTAVAATEFVSLSQNFWGELSPFQSNLAFSQIGSKGSGLPAQQILIECVSLRLDATISVSITVENDSTVPNTGIGVTLTGLVTANMGALSVSTSAFSAVLSEALAPSDGIPGSGPDFFAFGVIGETGSELDVQFDGLMPFLGDGDFFVDVHAFASIDFFNIGQSSIVIADYAVHGTVTVDIFYTTVPAPSGVVSILSAAALLVARRRRS